MPHNSIQDKRAYEYFNKRQSPQAPSHQPPSQQSPAQQQQYGGGQYREPGYTIDQHMSSRQIIHNDYITSQQVTHLVCITIFFTHLLFVVHYDKKRVENNRSSFVADVGPEERQDPVLPELAAQDAAAAAATAGRCGPAAKTGRHSKTHQAAVPAARPRGAQFLG